MKHHGPLLHPAIASGVFALVLLVPQTASALDIRFVLHGVMGVFRGLEARQTSGFPPAEAWLTSMPPNHAPEGLYGKASICQLPDCGFLSVDVSGRNLSTPARFHGFNGGWQLLITPSGSGASSGENWALQGLLFHCPGFEHDGDRSPCPEPTPDTEPRSGPLTPMPHGDPTDPGVPGPLPILGVAVAFGGSRRLRHRLRGRPSGH